MPDEPATEKTADPLEGAPWWARLLIKEWPAFWDRVTTGIITVVTLLIAADALSPDVVAKVVPHSVMNVVEVIGLLVTLYTQRKGKT